MKKKIINGILMVALVGATSTSFVSCKDTSEDVKTDLMAQVNAVKANLEPRVQQAESDIANLQGRMTTAEGDIVTLKGDVSNLKNRVANLEAEKDSLAQVTKTIEGKLTQVESKISTIVEALSKMVTSVTVNATSTSILSNSKLFPGLNLQFLGTAMGKAETTGKFPSTTTMNGHGVKLEAADFAGVEQYSWSNGDILPKADEETELADAGTIWFTLNPSNVKLENLKALKLVDSQNNESFVTISLKDAEKDTTTVLNWGITRAEEFTPALFKAQAGIDLEATDLATIAPAEIIDYKAVASDVRAILSEVKQAAEDANRSNYAELAKTTTKNVLKSSAQIVASLLQAKVPALPALALEAQWEDTVGVRSVLSDYSIAATAYKPLSFSFGKDLIDGGTVSFDKIDNAVARLINKIEAKISNIDLTNINVAAINITDLDAAKLTKKLYLYKQIAAPYSIAFSATRDLTTYPAATYDEIVLDVDMTDGIAEMLSTVNTKMSLNELSSLINQVKQIQKDALSYADRTKSFEVRVSDFLERELNRVITKVSTDGLTRILEPIILYQAGEYNVNRFFEGTKIPAGKVTLVPTTMTNELLAPAFKKYVAVKAADGSFAVQKLLTKGDKEFNQIDVTLAKGDYTVIYSALDFYGNQVSKKYNITVQ